MRPEDATGRHTIQDAALESSATLAGGPPVLNAAEAEVALEAPPASVAALLQDDEVVLLVLQPSLWFVPLSCIGSLLVIACLTLALAWLSHLPTLPWNDRQSFVLGAALMAARLAWQMLEWLSRSYVLTDRRILRRRGVLRVSVVEAPLRNVQNSVVYMLARDRVLGLGSIGFATLGSDSFNVWWETVRRPTQVHRTVMEAIERYGRR
ncbi:MAG: PH domain-containing protein [Phycisphaerales bacterium]|nr:PH domain-containing protein [Phycisphaerales bacterium]